MEKLEQLTLRIVFEGDGKYNDPDKILETLLNNDNSLAVADQRLLLAMQEDWKEYKDRVPEHKRVWNWKDILSRGETSLDQIKKLARMSDREMRANQIVLRLRNSRRRQGMSNLLSPGDLAYLRYLEFDQQDLDVLDMDLPRRKGYYLNSRPIWIRSGLKTMEELEEFVLRKYRFSGPSTKDPIMTALN
jgi:hypothetical protein